MNPADGPYDAVFVNGASSLTTKLFVKVPDYDGGLHKFGPVAWGSHSEANGDVSVTYYPAKGDPCAIIRTPGGRWWVLEWIDRSHTGLDDL